MNNKDKKIINSINLILNEKRELKDLKKLLNNNIIILNKIIENIKKGELNNG